MSFENLNCITSARLQFLFQLSTASMFKSAYSLTNGLNIFLAFTKLNVQTSNIQFCVLRFKQELEKMQVFFKVTVISLTSYFLYGKQCRNSLMQSCCIRQRCSERPHQNRSQIRESVKHPAWNNKVVPPIPPLLLMREILLCIDFNQFTCGKKSCIG